MLVRIVQQTYYLHSTSIDPLDSVRGVAIFSTIGTPGEVSGVPIASIAPNPPIVLGQAISLSVGNLKMMGRNSFSEH